MVLEMWEEVKGEVMVDMVREWKLKEGKEDVMEGEVLGGKGISMELLHKRLGHTSQGGMERLVREQLVRGLIPPGSAIRPDHSREDLRVFTTQ